MKGLTMFKYDGLDLKIHTAVDMANKYELLNYVYGEILRAPQYDMSDAPNTYIAKKWYEFMRLTDITVKVYYPKWRYSKAFGYFSPSNPRVININGYKLRRNINKYMMVSLFYHESGHAWNASDDKYNVHHEDNNSKGKENTMMYSVNRYVYNFYDYKYIPNKYYVPWYKKIFNFIKWW